MSLWMRWWLVLLLSLLTVIAPAPVQGQSAAKRFADLGYGDRTARGIDAVLDYYFPIPMGLRPANDGLLTLRFSHSPLLRPDRSTITVALNGQALASSRLTAENATDGVLAVPLPVAGFTGPGLFVQVQVHMRLTDDACEEVQNPALWTVVSGDSTLRLDLQPVMEGTLADLAALFGPLPLSAPTTRVPLALVLSPATDPATLQAGGIAAFAVGQWAALAGQDPVLTVADVLPGQAPAIVVALGPLPAGDWGSVRWNGTAYEVDGQAIPVDHGILVLAPTAPPQLLVAGATPTALTYAAQALTTALPAAPVLAAPAAPPAPVTAAWREGAASFAQLGITQRRVSGAGEHQIDYAFERPPGWDLRVGATLELHVVTAAGLTPATSWLAVAVNGITLGSQRLRVETNAVERYRFDLPADLLNSDLAGTPLRRIDLQVRLYLDLPNIGCEEVDTSAAWAVIEPTSVWRLPYDPAAANDLGRFPAALIGDTSARLVLPAQPTDIEIQAGLELAAAIGRWSATPDVLPPRLVTADAVGDERSGPLAILGDHNRNLLANALNVTANAPFVYQPGRSAQAMLHIVPSPWQSGARLLLIEAADGAGMRLGVQALRERVLLSVLRGVQAQITSDLNTTVVPLTPPLAAPPQTLTPQIEVALLERIPVWQFVGGILLIALLATAVLVVRIRWLRK
ncbi:cellulose biosynthesis cyclic di-GMP-binding regulatory protein BcsB [Chloroflexus sp.]|uniref:cellulose biosynthesis cyclic di-GMP-binding regulatory protein BcsB n=1 Tax=Chloroflexus sp. TaxID=1904827 RepID=UPI002ACDCA4D|nr:cellulose biosynthesis cyclic di-GMP-binding regulatory protein BcsB [Chloroflexus sp.]